jgi:hypothetical protein
VHVPKGEHTLVMRFEPAVDEYGVWVSATATVIDYGGILGLLGLYYRRRYWHEEVEDEEE